MGCEATPLLTKRQGTAAQSIGDESPHHKSLFNTDVHAVPEIAMSILLTHLLSWSAALLLLDALLWHLAPFKHRAPRVGVRLVLFLAFSALAINAGVSPLQAPLFADDPVTQLGRRRWAFSGGCTPRGC